MLLEVARLLALAVRSKEAALADVVNTGVDTPGVDANVDGVVPDAAVPALAVGADATTTGAAVAGATGSVVTSSADTIVGVGVGASVVVGKTIPLPTPFPEEAAVAASMLPVGEGDGNTGGNRVDGAAVICGGGGGEADNDAEGGDDALDPDVTPEPDAPASVTLEATNAGTSSSDATVAAATTDMDVEKGAGNRDTCADAAADAKAMGPAKFTPRDGVVDITGNAWEEDGGGGGGGEEDAGGSSVGDEGAVDLDHAAATDPDLGPLWVVCPSTGNGELVFRSGVAAATAAATAAAAVKGVLMPVLVWCTAAAKGIWPAPGPAPAMGNTTGTDDGGGVLLRGLLASAERTGGSNNRSVAGVRADDSRLRCGVDPPPSSEDTTSASELVVPNK